VMTLEKSDRLFEKRAIERPGDAGPGLVLEGGPHRADDQAIAIVAQHGVSPGAEFGRSIGHAPNHNIFGQEAVGHVKNRADRQAAFDQTGRRLPEGVNPGVGPAGGPQRHGLAQGLAQGVLDLFLDGGAVGLSLPAQVARSVILQAQKKVPFHVIVGFVFPFLEERPFPAVIASRHAVALAKAGGEAIPFFSLALAEIASSSAFAEAPADSSQ